MVTIKYQCCRLSLAMLNFSLRSFSKGVKFIDVNLQVVQLTKFDYRLSNMLDEELQKLRCRANYHALRFVKPIEDLGHRLVKRMRNMAKRYIAIHLRFTLTYSIQNFVPIFCKMLLSTSSYYCCPVLAALVF